MIQINKYMYIIKMLLINFKPNPEAIAARAVELSQDEMLRERLSRNALAWAKEFNWERSAGEFLRVVEENV